MFPQNYVPSELCSLRLFINGKSNEQQHYFNGVFLVWQEEKYDFHRLKIMLTVRCINFISVGISQADRAGLDKDLKGDNSE